MCHNHLPYCTMMGSSKSPLGAELCRDLGVVLLAEQDVDRVARQHQQHAVHHQCDPDKRRDEQHKAFDQVFTHG